MINKVSKDYIGRWHQAIHSQAERKQAKAFANFEGAIDMEELVVPGESIVNSSITRIKREGKTHIMITIQHRIITITDPREAKEIDLKSERKGERYLKLRNRQRGISMKR